MTPLTSIVLFAITFAVYVYSSKTPKPGKNLEDTDSKASDILLSDIKGADQSARQYYESCCSNYELIAKFDNLTRKFQNTEQALNNMKAEIKILRGENSIGVYCSSCNKMQNRTSYPNSCKEIYDNGNQVSGIYKIYPDHADAPFPVLCDMDIRGGGWTHIQKRFDGSENFYREWRDYKFGFGDLEGEFWLGLKKIQIFAGFGPVELLVEVVDRSGEVGYAHYSSFGIAPESEGYTLRRIAGFTGNAGDSLSFHLGHKFSTKDVDFTQHNCATKHKGAWWYYNCLKSNLNAKYINVDMPATKYYHQGLYWSTFRDGNYYLAKSRMLVRPLS